MQPKTTNEWNFPIVIPSHPLKRQLKKLVGRLALLSSPATKEALLAGKPPENSRERAALAAIVMQLKERNEVEKLAELHRKVWASNATQGYYQLTASRVRSMYALLREDIYQSLSSLMQRNGYDTLIELGCGEGVVLDDLSTKFGKDIGRFVGIDINKAQIETNQSVYASNPKLEFIAGDLTSVIASVKGSGKIFLTFGGVLEYLTERELLSLLEDIGAEKNCALLLYEPITAGFDPRTAQHSILYGSESSFSHPYHVFLKKTGFQIESERLVESGDTNWLFLSATNS